jgi:hypothetical protein
MNLLVDIALRQPQLFEPLAAEYARGPSDEDAGILVIPSYEWEGWTVGAEEPDEAFFERERRGPLGWWLTAVPLRRGEFSDGGALAVLPDDDLVEANIATLRAVQTPDGAALARKHLDIDALYGEAEVRNRLFEIFGRLRDRPTDPLGSCAPSADDCLKTSRCDRTCHKYKRSVGRGREIHCVCA